MRWARLWALAAALIWCAPVSAADHRDAPAIDEDLASDLADVYAFRDPADPNFVILALTVNPFSSPSEGDTYFFSPEVLYRFNIDQNLDGITDQIVSVIFTRVVNNTQAVAAALPGGVVVQGFATPPTAARTPNPAIINSGPNGTLLFAGQRDDPFFFDVIGFKRFLAGGGLSAFRGIDAFGGVNVSAIVLRLPASSVFGSSTKVGISASTYRLSRDFSTTGVTAPPVQVDRMGNPAVNVVFVPSALKDAYNKGEPQNDARDFGAAIVGTLTSLGTNAANQQTLGSIAIPDTLKFDRTLPDGYPNGRRLQDDVVNVLLTLTNNAPTSDGVDANDRPFLDTFPFMAPPQQAP